MRQCGGAALQIAAPAVLLAAYAGLSHYCNTRGMRSMGATLALIPLAAVGTGVLWRSAGAWIAAASTVAAAILLYDCWPQLEQHYTGIYLLQECCMYGLLAFGFAGSLRPGETALCTRLADRLHGPLTPGEVRYSRGVTWAWAAFFSALTLLILGLYLYVPVPVWSLFVNFVVLPLIALMFLTEYAVRRVLLPRTDRPGVLASVRVFLSSR